ncbi:MAG: Uncharacterised protein [Porticoccaceae bacterium UBA1117]|nr:MAG: Uncharacterised protein [Porticoccaceae bacterium UBA1117]
MSPAVATTWIALPPCRTSLGQGWWPRLAAEMRERLLCSEAATPALRGDQGTYPWIDQSGAAVAAAHECAAQVLRQSQRVQERDHLVTEARVRRICEQPVACAHYPSGSMTDKHLLACGHLSPTLGTSGFWGTLRASCLGDAARVSVFILPLKSVLGCSIVSENRNESSGRMTD